MNGSDMQQGIEHAYGSRCQYRNTCPARTRCPYCPYRMEGMNPGYHGNMNMQMEYYVKDNVNPVPYPYEDIAPQEFGNENLYPMPYEMAAEPGNENDGSGPASPQYNPYGYIYPNENVYSPWANNAMYGETVNPLPMKNCPFE